MDIDFAERLQTQDNIMAAGPSQGMMRGLCDAFASLDDASISAASSGGGSSSMMAMNMSGSVATVVMCLDRHLVVANVGDARAVLCVQGVGGEMSAVDLSEDHRPGLVSIHRYMHSRIQTRIQAFKYQPTCKSSHKSTGACGAPQDTYTDG
jgi:serine/threonine protein phosphatase PrpC